MHFILLQILFETHAEHPEQRTERISCGVPSEILTFMNCLFWEKYTWVIVALLVWAMESFFWNWHWFSNNINSFQFSFKTSWGAFAYLLNNSRLSRGRWWALLVWNALGETEKGMEFSLFCWVTTAIFLSDLAFFASFFFSSVPCAFLLRVFWAFFASSAWKLHNDKNPG